MFLVLYPIGMLSEVGLIYVTMPYMKVIQITKDMKSSMLVTSMRVLLNSSILWVTVVRPPINTAFKCPINGISPSTTTMHLFF